MLPPAGAIRLGCQICLPTRIELYIEHQLFRIPIDQTCEENRESEDHEHAAGDIDDREHDGEDHNHPEYVNCAAIRTGNAIWPLERSSLLRLDQHDRRIVVRGAVPPGREAMVRPAKRPTNDIGGLESR